MRIYVAGPYTPKNCDLHDASRIAMKNVDKAIEVGNALIEKGHFPFIPHLSHYVHVHHSSKKDYGIWYYRYDESFLKYWAEALFYISSSKGADDELKLAKDLGLKIFYCLEDVPILTS